EFEQASQGRLEFMITLVSLLISVLGVAITLIVVFFALDTRKRALDQVRAGLADEREAMKLLLERTQRDTDQQRKLLERGQAAPAGQTDELLAVLHKAIDDGRRDAADIREYKSKAELDSQNITRIARIALKIAADERLSEAETTSLNAAARDARLKPEDE